MKLHKNFLEFNGTNTLFKKTENEYWVALRPILESLNLEESSYLKKTKRSYFFSTCLDNMSIQVENNGIKQGRTYTCLPERYIYSWICTLNSDNEDLIAYQRTCSDLLFNHFNGIITNRKDLLIERKEKEIKISELKEKLKNQDEDYRMIQQLESEKKDINSKLNAIDKSITNQYEMDL